jgi:hypothetical protein
MLELCFQLPKCLVFNYVIKFRSKFNLYYLTAGFDESRFIINCTIRDIHTRPTKREEISVIKNGFLSDTSMHAIVPCVCTRRIRSAAAKFTDYQT